ncbi:C40 family peptidase [Serratia phage vB_SlqS_ZDD2]|nr:C40 family peptidase [Serratia phage vB_SlqS_ZDD2]
MIRMKVVKQIMEHAKACYPNEACGVVMQKGISQHFVPVQNVDQDPANSFTMNPQQYDDLESGMMNLGEIAYIVHSHPDATAIASERDLAQCNEHKIPWAIVSWPEGDLRYYQPEELPLVGRPFSLGAYDCWGLIMAYFKQEHGIELHDYRVPYAWWEKGENLYMDNWYEAGFREFEGPIQAGDMAMIQVKSEVVNHAGVFTEDGYLLHHLYGYLSREDVYGGYMKERTIKIVRHKDLFK